MLALEATGTVLVRSGKSVACTGAIELSEAVTKSGTVQFGWVAAGSSWVAHCVKRQERGRERERESVIENG